MMTMTGFREEAPDFLIIGLEVPSMKVTETDLNDLHDPVQRYLQHAEELGRETIRPTRLKQTGVFKPSPEADWSTISAEQYFSTDPLSFLWLGKIKMNPLVTVSDKDSYVVSDD